MRIERNNTAGATDLPLWVTEVGVSSTTGAFWPPPVTEEQQASYLINVINQAKVQSDVEAMLLHTVDEGPIFWGTVHGDGFGGELRFHPLCV